MIRSKDSEPVKGSNGFCRRLDLYTRYLSAAMMVIFTLILFQATYAGELSHAIATTWEVDGRRFFVGIPHGSVLKPNS